MFVFDKSCPGCDDHVVCDCALCMVLCFAWCEMEEVMIPSEDQQSTLFETWKKLFTLGSFSQNHTSSKKRSYMQISTSLRVAIVDVTKGPDIPALRDVFNIFKILMYWSKILNNWS